MKTFNVIFIGAFILFGVLGIILFATGGGVSKTSTVQAPKVIIWGTLPEEAMINFIRSENAQNGVNFINASYEYRDPKELNQALLEAAANGTGPDMIIASSDELWEKKERISAIPVSSYPDRNFKDTFIEAAEELRTSAGYLGVPLISDPLVMYWNRDLFTKENISRAPDTWEQVLALVPKLAKVDQALGISQSALAMGEFRNVNNAKEILASLLFQSSNPITDLTINDKTLEDTLNVVLNRRYDSSSPQSAIAFFNQFSDPSKKVYTWNRSLTSSLDAFLTGSLSMYFGKASEAPIIAKRNPNLNFDVAIFPRLKDNPVAAVYSDIYVMSLVKNSNNKAEAFNVMNVLTSPQVQVNLSKMMKLSSVRRDVVASDLGDASIAVFNQATIQSQMWLDPNADATKDIFATMIESISSGRTSPVQAINEAGDQMGKLIK